MAIDICVEVMRVDPGKLPAEYYQQWDVVAVYPATQQGKLSGESYVPNVTPAMKRTCWIFVTGVPANSLEELTFHGAKEVNMLSLDKEVTHYKKFGGDATKIEPTVLTKMLDDKWESMTWTEFKGFFVHRIDGAAMVDADLTA